VMLRLEGRSQRERRQC